ncbi:MAG: cbb3-type cytochrome oxidase assembly protein CcoS [Planctomycetes bacterium]|nr:cbb3-type cytochrome oxidase assembly protein CcoS [Planctomycetota bacterium]
MSVLYIALPIAILLGGAGLLACLYCIRSGQYDDLESPSVRVLIDDVPVNTQAGSDDPCGP